MISFNRAALAALAILAMTAIAVPASAKPREANGLHNARYCEFIVIKGALPNVVVTVWNTIKLNRCPAEQWNSFDAAELAEELGAAAVVLNGPRHFLMDSATAETGPVRSFHGMRARKVATIPITNAADLSQVTYRERVIERTNTWKWKRGRLVHELIAPCGARYMMQAYSQIRDPKLKIDDLPSLGERLALPAGWRYSTRRLKHDLVLTARGKARVIQDDLLNTYQREPRATGPAKPTRHQVEVIGDTKTTGSPSPGVLVDEGTISGDPFGDGTIRLAVTFSGANATAPFTIKTADGAANGRAWMDYTIHGSQISFDGTACFSDGTGAYKGIHGSGLKATDTNTLDGQSGKISLDGFATH